MQAYCTLVPKQCAKMTLAFVLSVENVEMGAAPGAPSLRCTPVLAAGCQPCL